MENHIAQPSPESSAPANEDHSNTAPSVPAERHPVLARLMEEVRNERSVAASYDRVHHRHNRGR